MNKSRAIKKDGRWFTFHYEVDSLVIGEYQFYEDRKYIIGDDKDIEFIEKLISKDYALSCPACGNCIIYRFVDIGDTRQVQCTRCNRFIRITPLDKNRMQIIIINK